MPFFFNVLGSNLDCLQMLIFYFHLLPSINSMQTLGLRVRFHENPLRTDGVVNKQTYPGWLYYSMIEGCIPPCREIARFYYA